MNNLLTLKPRPTLQVEAKPEVPYLLQKGDRVEIAGMSHHQGEIVGIKNSSYSGLTYSVRVYGEIYNKILEGVNPLALTKL